MSQTYSSDIRYFNYHLYNPGIPKTVDVKIAHRNYLASRKGIAIISNLFNFTEIEDEGYTKMV